MLTHQKLWDAIDHLASAAGLSTSGLARAAGLDATTFNKSKRLGPDGRQRWPSMESVVRALEAAGASLTDLQGLAEQGADAVASVEDTPLAPRLIPVIGLAQAGHGGFFDDAGYPVGDGWDYAEFPALTDKDAYALEISGDSMLPLIRPGDIIIISPALPVRRGDRVVAKTFDGQVMAKELLRITNRRVELGSFNPAHEPLSFTTDQLVWMSRIIWVSQ